MTRASFVAALACLLLAGCGTDMYEHREIDGKEYECRIETVGITGTSRLIECIPIKAFIREKPRGCAGE